MTSPRATVLLALCSIAIATLPAQQPAQSTETPSRPFSIRQDWIIGGVGAWDYLTMDVSAQRLYIAHANTVQVVDVTTGAVAGKIIGLGEAHQVVLDDTGEFGYVSDGRSGRVVVFDRRTLETVANIEDVPSPRSLVFEPQTRLLFAVHPAPRPPAPVQHIPRTTTHITPRPAPPEPAPNPGATSSITVIDTETRKIVAQIQMFGTLGFAQADGRGQIYVNVTDHNQVIRLDAQTVAGQLAKPPEPASSTPETAPAESQKKADQPVNIDWSSEYGNHPFRTFRLGSGCTSPRSLAVDSAHSRVFAACDNMRLAVLNADDGNQIASLPIGPGVDGVAYDAEHNLIFSANGGADGTLTVIRQHVTDSYSVIQTLPTRQRARTLAVDSQNGQVYLVTDLLGMDLSKPGGVGTLETNPVNGSFQVLVVGN
jgi:DNA-binding beta-propeller fold protein YncE